MEWEKRVPPSGGCATLKGEIMRAAGRIHYDYYNNGFGNNWSGALNFLEAHLQAPAVPGRDELRRYCRGRIYPRHAYGPEMDLTLERLLEAALDHEDGGPYDMFDMQEPDLTWREEEELEEEGA